MEAPLELSFGITNSYLLYGIVLNCFHMTKFLEFHGLKFWEHRQVTVNHSKSQLVNRQAVSILIYDV